MELKLPKDAECREIPLDTECLYTYKGEKQDVLSFIYNRKEEKWEIETDLRIVNSICLYITPPDSWEMLEDDLYRVVETNSAFYTTACAYMNKGVATCNDCRLHGHNTSSCTDEMFKDVVSRIRKLSGKDE